MEDPIGDHIAWIAAQAGVTPDMVDAIFPIINAIINDAFMNGTSIWDTFNTINELIYGIAGLPNPAMAQAASIVEAPVDGAAFNQTGSSDLDLALGASGFATAPSTADAPMDVENASFAEAESVDADVLEIDGGVIDDGFIA
jgi:hypothetical protein